MRAGRFDAAVDLRVHAHLDGHPAIVGLAQLGDPIPMAILTGGLLLVCLLTRRWRGALLVAVAVPGASALTEFALKPLVHRTMTGALSFPSGHATGVFAVAMASAMLLSAQPATPPRMTAAVTVIAAAGVVAAAIVGTHAHYTTDTVGGAAVATAVVLLVALAIDRLSPTPQ